MSGGTVWAVNVWATDVWAAGLWTSGASAPLLVESISNKSVASNSGTYQYDFSTKFFGATSYSIAPALEVGWSFNTSTGVFEIDTDADGTFGPYTVTGTNVTGSTDQNAFIVIVGAVGENMAQTPTVGMKQAMAFDLTDIERDY